MSQSSHESAPTLSTAQAQSLPRLLGFWTAACIVVGTVIGSGVFKKPQAVAVQIPEFGLAMSAWVLGGLLALVGGMILAEVAVLLPRAGGNYVFLKEAYGRWAGFLFGWVEFWIIRSASIAALASIFTDSLHGVIQGLQGTQSEVIAFWPRQAITVGVIVVLGMINARGTRLGGGLQVFLTAVKVLSLIAIFLLPFAVWAFVSNPPAVPDLARVSPWWPADWSQVNWSNYGAALVGVLWAYHGWMNIAPIAEEVKDPQRNLPLALLLGVLALIALYLGANIAYYLILPHSEIVTLKDGTTVCNGFAVRLLGPIGGLLASAAVMTSVFGSLNGNLLVGPRLVYAMSRDRLAPAVFSEVHAVYRTPVAAVIVLMGWSVILVVGAALLSVYRLPVLVLMGRAIDLNVPDGKPLFDIVTDFAIFGAVAFETLAVASLFVLRRRYPLSQVSLPYRCPLFPLLPIIYCTIMTLVLINMFQKQSTEAMVGMAFILVGAIVYALTCWRDRGQKS